MKHSMISSSGDKRKSGCEEEKHKKDGSPGLLSKMDCVLGPFSVAQKMASNSVFSLFCRVDPWGDECGLFSGVGNSKRCGGPERAFVFLKTFFKGQKRE